MQPKTTLISEVIVRTRDGSRSERNVQATIQQTPRGVTLVTIAGWHGDSITLRLIGGDVIALIEALGGHV